MKKWILTANIFLENLLSNMMIFVFAVLLAYMLQGLSGLYVAYSQRLIMAEKIQLTDRILVNYLQSDDQMGLQPPDLSSYYEEVMKIDGVQAYCPISTFGVFSRIDEAGVSLRTDPIMSDTYKDIQYKLIEGSWPDEPNEVVLADYAKDFVRLGDTFSVSLDSIGNDFSIQSAEAVITIVGFVDAESLVFNFDTLSARPGLQDVTTTLSAVAIDYNSIENREMYGFILAPTDSTGQSIRTSLRRAKYMVTLEPDADLTSVESELALIFGKTRIHSGIGMINKYKEDYREEFLLLLRFSVILLILVVTGIFSSVFLQLNMRKKEMAAYYLCGASWRQSIFLFCGIYYPLIILGTLAGSALYVNLTRMKLSDNGRYTGWIMLLLLALCTVQILPQYISAIRTSPIEYIRKD